ncbi:MAG: hypothetical protein IT306_10530 [Chloroflexi bacterium]|nr:hypothetical protein [Chloroflexota bacterium]
MTGRRPDPRPELLEVVSPRTNAAGIAAAEQLFASLAVSEPFSLEIAAHGGERRFLARAGSKGMRERLRERLRTAYPQAELRPLDFDRYPDLDPARPSADERVCARALVLAEPPYQPLKTFRDADIDAERAAQADPVLGIVGALGGLTPGWRALTQLVCRPAPPDWARPYLRLAVEDPLEPERARRQADRPTGTSDAQVGGLVALLALGLAAWQVQAWLEAGRWLELGLAAAALPTTAFGAALAWRRLHRERLYDRRLVAEKLAHPAFWVQLRLAVFGPAATGPAELEGWLAGLVGAYHRYDLPLGNRFAPVALRAPEGAAPPLWRPDHLPPTGARALLNARELAGLWHLPQAASDVPLVERTTARARLPLPILVARGCRIGVSAHQGEAVEVRVADELLGRHLLLVAKTRRGKSALLGRLAAHLMAAPVPAGHRALLLVDPHRDLARAALGLVPPARRDAVVYLDLARDDRPFGLNLLDVALFGRRNKAVANALGVFRYEFAAYWGPRMEDAFRHALLTLYDANRALCATGPDGRSRQHTILDVPALLVDVKFRQQVLKSVDDPVVRAWWETYYAPLDARLRLEIANPVLTKIQRYAGDEVARAIVGQPASTIHPSAWIRDGAIVLVDGAQGAGGVGEDTTALVCATLVNLFALAIGEQAALPPARRRPAAIIVDEFHALPGAQYEPILAQRAKHGASLCLAIQGFGQLDALDRKHDRALRRALFENLDGLFAFHCSAEDARYLVRELGEGVDEQDLVGLGPYRCYARLSADDGRPPAFSVQLDPPPAPDEVLADALAEASARRWGRPAAEVDGAIRAALARIALAGRQLVGLEDEASGTEARERRPAPPARNEYRSRGGKGRKGGRPPERADSGGRQLPLGGLADATSGPTPQAAPGPAGSVAKGPA